MNQKIKLVLKSIFVLVLFAASIRLFAAWQDPTNVPPGGNVYPPINTNGSIPQYIPGSLIVDGLRVNTGLQFTLGTPGATGKVLISDDIGNASWATPTSFQTPWASNIDAAGFNLTGVGKVGIGKTIPQATLDVYGIDNSSDSTIGLNVFNESGATAGGKARTGGVFEASSDNAATTIGVQGVGNNSSISGWQSSTGVMGVGRYTYASGSTFDTNLIGVRGQIDTKDDSGTNTFTITGSGASLYTNVDIKQNKTLDTYYALEMTAPTGSGIINHKYGVYQEDTASANYFAGKVGIGTTSPAFKLQVSGDIGTAGTAPTVSSSTCGTSPSVRGTDTAGEITVGSGTPTSCALTFASSKTKVPFCTVTNKGPNSNPMTAVTISVNGIAISQLGIQGQKIDYICIGANN